MDVGAGQPDAGVVDGQHRSMSPCAGRAPGPDRLALPGIWRFPRKRWPTACPASSCVRAARRGDPAHQHAAGLRHADENYVARAAVARARQKRREGSVSMISSAGSKRAGGVRSQRRLAAGRHRGVAVPIDGRGAPTRTGPCRHGHAGTPVECRYHGRDVTTAEMAAALAERRPVGAQPSPRTGMTERLPGR